MRSYPSSILPASNGLILSSAMWLGIGGVLTLKVLMLVWSLEAVRQWQASG